MIHSKKAVIGRKKVDPAASSWPGTRAEKSVRAAGSGNATRNGCARRPLRIMHVVNWLRRGGMEFGILKLVSGLDPELFEHRFCTTRRYDADFVKLYGLEQKVDCAGQPKDGFQFPLIRLWRIFQRYRPDIVHTRNWGALEAILAARLAGVPVVIHSEHGYEVENLKGIPLRRRLFRRYAYSKADAIFAVTCELRNYYASHVGVPGDRIGVLYNGVDATRFSPAPVWRSAFRAKLGLPENAFLIGSVGRIVPIKDYPTLLKAVRVLSERGLDFHLVIAGGGHGLDNLRLLSKEIPGYGSRVTLLDSFDDIPLLLRAIDVYVLSSLAEGMSNTLLEAMASGLPVVATDVGGNPEVIGNCESGLLFRAGDFHGLAEILHRLSVQPGSRARLGAAARARVSQDFSLEAMLQNYRDLYVKTAKRRGVLLRAGWEEIPLSNTVSLPEAAS